MFNRILLSNILDSNVVVENVYKLRTLSEGKFGLRLLNAKTTLPVK